VVPTTTPLLDCAFVPAATQVDTDGQAIAEGRYIPGICEAAHALPPLAVVTASAPEPFPRKLQAEAHDMAEAQARLPPGLGSGGQT
jgi:hypothetical protein